MHGLFERGVAGDIVFFGIHAGNAAAARVADEEAVFERGEGFGGFEIAGVPAAEAHRLAEAFGVVGNDGARFGVCRPNGALMETKAGGPVALMLHGKTALGPALPVKQPGRAGGVNDQLFPAGKRHGAAADIPVELLFDLPEAVAEFGKQVHAFGGGGRFEGIERVEHIGDYDFMFKRFLLSGKNRTILHWQQPDRLTAVYEFH